MSLYIDRTSNGNHGAPYALVLSDTNVFAEANDIVTLGFVIN